MPRWLTHARNFAGLRRRWGVGSPFAEVLDGVLPVIQVDKHRQADDQDIYGLFVQALGDGVNLRACGIQAQEHEVLVHKVEIWNTGVAFTTQQQDVVHIFTPLQAYNPFDVAQAAYFSWMQGSVRAGDAGRLSNTFGVGGLGAGAQVVVVNGVPTVTIGPCYSWQALWGLPGEVVVFDMRPIVAWSFQDPPIRLKPFQMLCAQDFFVGRLNETMNVSFFYSERQPQGDVG